MNPNPNQLMTVPQFCDRAQISRATFYRQCVKAGGLRILRIGGSARIRPEDAAAYFAALAEKSA